MNSARRRQAGWRESEVAPTDATDASDRPRAAADTPKCEALNSAARFATPELEARQAAMVHDSVRNSPLEDTWLRADLAPATQRALAALPEVPRSAVILVDMQDLKYDDAARVLEVPVGTVRSRLFR